MSNASSTGPPPGIDAAPRATRVSVGLAALLLLVTLGEGGGSPASLVVWHGCLVALAVACLVRSGDRAGRGLSGAAIVAFGLFAALFALGVARAPYTYAASLVAIELGCCVLAARLAAAAGLGPLRFIVWPLRLAAAVQGLYAIYQWGVLDHERPAGTFLTPNALALWMVAVLLLSVGAGARSPRGWALVAASAAPAILAFYLAGSRGAFVGLVFGGLGLMVMRWGGMQRSRRIAAVAVLVLLALPAGFRLVERLNDFDPFRYHRLRIWRASLGVVVQDPWWGSGPGQFATVAANHNFPDGDGPLRYDKVFSATHSDLLRVPAEFGIPAAVALLAAVGLAVRRIVRRRRAGQLPLAADGALAALIAVAADALVDNPSRWPAVYLLASVLLGSLLSTRPTGRGVQIGRSVRAGLGVMLILLFVVGDVGPFLAWKDISRLPRGRLEEPQQRQLRRALDLNPIHPDYWLRLAEHVAGDGTDWGLDDYVEAREAAERAVRLHRNGARYHHGLARLEARACRTLFADEPTRSRAQTHFEEAERLARFDAFTPLGLAAFLIDTGDPAGARRAAERALALEPEAVLPRLLLADAFIEAGAPGDLQRAAALLEQARIKAVHVDSRIEGAYARRLLQPDPGVLDRLETKLREALDETTGQGTPR